mmetsp:Transcript_542/g.807  ORF Transcript_542/g.807 Transcript_542/m.807 type:complete len:217 (-) Transcript_542:202-852(-)
MAPLRSVLSSLFRATGCNCVLFCSGIEVFFRGELCAFSCILSLWRPGAEIEGVAMGRSNGSPLNFGCLQDALVLGKGLDKALLKDNASFENESFLEIFDFFAPMATAMRIGVESSTPISSRLSLSSASLPSKITLCIWTGNLSCRATDRFTFATVSPLLACTRTMCAGVLISKSISLLASRTNRCTRSSFDPFSVELILFRVRIFFKSLSDRCISC